MICIIFKKSHFQNRLEKRLNPRWRGKSLYVNVFQSLDAKNISYSAISKQKKKAMCAVSFSIISRRCRKIENPILVIVCGVRVQIRINTMIVIPNDRHDVYREFAFA